MGTISGPTRLLRLLFLRLYLSCVTLSWHVAASPFDLETRHILSERDREASDALLPPSQDPWYRAPQGWESTEPGSVLKTRTSVYRPISLPNAINTFQFPYRTTDSYNNASWAVATVFVPSIQSLCTATASSRCAHGLITYAIAYDSVDIDASPSYILQLGDSSGELASVLKNGWFLVIPDFEGPLASYTAGVQAGHATLDATRAALKLVPSYGFQTNNSRVGLWGYSGGATAVSLAAEMAAEYAPDLKFNGAVIGGPTPNLTTVARNINRQDAAGLLVASIIGITSQNSGARDFLMSRLRTSGPYNTTGFFSALRLSGAETAAIYKYQDISRYFINGTQDLFDRRMTDLFDSDGNMGLHGTPNMPVFVFKATNDDMSPVAETDGMVARFCSQGANILYHRNSVGDHDSELTNGRPRALAFLQDVMNGVIWSGIPAKGCSTVNVTIQLT